ncbi:hypothetical protein [Luteimicrobium subarcticum]|uniref:Uncharacterized protein n=1 Tax=Luteimicrobium subarcticum TaxID=620910 RepID=A0A2M8WWG5_9MICO|nr:hypothetical protein [Luteimicrobium subarcticum]PJI95263.1 hypothetical protein CLV34_0026 [Luteimicrobium subarcticum]
MSTQTTRPTPSLADVHALLDATDRRRLAELDHLESVVLRRLVDQGDSTEMPLFSEVAARRGAVYREAVERPATRTTALDVVTPAEGVTLPVRSPSTPR